MNYKRIKYSNINHENMKVLDKNIGELLCKNGMEWKTNFMVVRKNLQESLELLGWDSWKGKSEGPK